MNQIIELFVCVFFKMVHNKTVKFKVLKTKSAKKHIVDVFKPHKSPFPRSVDKDNVLSYTKYKHLLLIMTSKF